MFVISFSSTCIDYFEKSMEIFFVTLWIIPIFDVSLLDNIQKSSIFLFKSCLSFVLISLKILFPWLGAFVAISVIIKYSEDITDIKYISKWHIYWFAQPLVYYHNVYMPYFNIPFSDIFWINETYEHVNHMHTVHCHYFYMNEIMVLFHWYLDQQN